MRDLYLLAAAAAGTAVVGAAPGSCEAGDKIEGSYICVFKEGAVSRANVHAEANRAAGAALGHVYEQHPRIFRMSAARAAAPGSRNPNIAYCEQDQEVDAIQSGPLDFRIVGKPAGRAAARSLFLGRHPGQWRLRHRRRSGTAWVIDTGIDLDHPDLNVDKARSRNFSTGASPEDGNGHGTHVAGIIGAKDNSIGVVGVSPGATLVAVRVLNNAGSGTNSGVIAGVDYVAANGHNGDVANMSLGGGISQALDNAVVNAAATGVKFTLAAGNESDSAHNHSPARANGPNVYTVSAFAKAQRDRYRRPVGVLFQLRHPPVDYAEPGSSIPSTYKNGGYATLSGTSMAAPHLAGICSPAPQ